MGYIKRFFSKRQEQEETLERKGFKERFIKSLKDKLGIKMIFSKFFILIGIAVIVGIVSFKYLKGQRLKGGSGFFSKSNNIIVLPNILEERRIKIRIGNRSFLVRVAERKKEWEKGLMWVKKLGKNEGMLFKFGKQVDYGFWMKNTLIPLTILFINKNMKVNGAVNMEPCAIPQRMGGFFNTKALRICPQYMPKNKYMYAVEIGREKNISKYIGKKLHIGKK